VTDSAARPAGHLELGPRLRHDRAGLEITDLADDDEPAADEGHRGHERGRRDRRERGPGPRDRDHRHPGAPDLGPQVRREPRANVLGEPVASVLDFDHGDARGDRRFGSGLRPEHRERDDEDDTQAERVRMARA
jgi:hypothetical protein